MLIKFISRWEGFINTADTSTYVHPLDFVHLDRFNQAATNPFNMADKEKGGSVIAYKAEAGKNREASANWINAC